MRPHAPCVVCPGCLCRERPDLTDRVAAGVAHLARHGGTASERCTGDARVAHVATAAVAAAIVLLLLLWGRLLNGCRLGGAAAVLGLRLELRLRKLLLLELRVAVRGLSVTTRRARCAVPRLGLESLRSIVSAVGGLLQQVSERTMGLEVAWGRGQTASWMHHGWHRCPKQARQ